MTHRHERRRALRLSLLVLIIAAASAPPPAAAQEAAPAPPPLTIGDPAPPLVVEAYLKGEPVAAFAPDRVYLVDFWATWCQPCVLGMPHLTELQAKYADRLTVIGVDVWEGNASAPYTEQTRAKVAAFVAARDSVLGYRIAYDGSAQRAATEWLRAAGLRTIPSAFIIDGQARIAGIGNPLQPAFEATLAAVLAGTHDLAAAREAWNLERERVTAEAAARQVAGRRLAAAVTAALPLIRAGRHADGVAALDTLDGVFTALGPHARDAAKVSACRELFGAGELATAHAFIDHLLAADAFTSGLELSEIAWLIVNPDAPIDGADPRRAVRCAERALALLSPEELPLRSIVLELQARGLWQLDERERAVAVLREAVAAESNERLRAELEKLLASYVR